MNNKLWVTALEEKIKTLENAIRENEKILDKLTKEQLFSEKVLDSLPGIFYLYDGDENLIRWNKDHELLTGFSAEELPERKMLEWFSGSDRDRIKESVGQLYEKGGKVGVEARLIIKDGTRVPYYFTGVRMIVDDRRYLLGVGVDSTDLKKTEVSLKKSEENYRAIVENAVEGIYQSTPEGKMISANASMAKILGYDSPEDLKHSISDISKNLYVLKDVRNDFISLMHQNKPVSGFEVEFYRKNKTRIWVSLHARPVFNSNEELSLIEGMILDITEKKKQREALQKSEALLREENLRLKSNIKDRYRFGNIIGKSQSMQEVYELILKASATDANVIISGESGTGKELVARAIHDFSDRKKGRFVPVNCGAIPENLLESEFFGYKKGAFTGASSDKKGFLDMAEGGTLFLDELGEITLNLQVKLLRVIEGRGFTPVGGKEIKKPDIRILATTNRNLQHRVKTGKMREDFFYRIHIIPITLPPLRDRKEDIPLIVDHFLKEMTKGNPDSIPTGEMVETMLNHSWPGNVRELQNVIQRYVTMGHFDLINQTGRFPSVLKRKSTPSVISDGATYSDAMGAFEKQLLIQILASCQWNREKAASQLDIPIRTFYRKLKKHNLKRQNVPYMT
jgi:PAS domain S-box-containing protein